MRSMVPEERKAGVLAFRWAKRKAAPTKLTPLQQISGDKEEEHHRNHSIHGEKRRIQLTQIIVTNKHVLIEQKRSHSKHSRNRQLT